MESLCFKTSKLESYSVFMDFQKKFRIFQPTATYQNHVHFHIVGRCRANEYRCGKGWCINNSLKCNNYNPCGAHSDCPLGPGAVVGIVIACAVFLVILFLCVMFVRRRGYQVGCKRMLRINYRILSIFRLD